jgi:hypothetical protein
MALGEHIGCWDSATSSGRGLGGLVYRELALIFF